VPLLWALLPRQPGAGHETVAVAGAALAVALEGVAVALEETLPVVEPDVL
jgi:hypothetical protein